MILEAARLALGPPAGKPLDFFEVCWRKRIVIDYHHASVATYTEAEEIAAEAKALVQFLDHWIAADHPKLAPESLSCSEVRTRQLILSVPPRYFHSSATRFSLQTLNS